MATLYVTSLAPGAGSTAVAASLVYLLARQGRAAPPAGAVPTGRDAPTGPGAQPRKAAYVKPLAVIEGAKPAADADAVFCKAALGLPEDISLIGPLVVEPSAVAGGLGSLAAALKQRLLQVSAGKDAVVIDGLPAGASSAAASSELAGLADAEVVAVVRYRRGMDVAEVAALKERFGRRLLGVILNAVPPVSRRAARDETAPAIEAEGVRVLGVLPEERMLLGFTVAEYEARLGGRIINNHENAGEIVESILLGAMALDPAEYYYERKQNKALVTRGDRPDLQWTALESSTRCLILTQNIEPIPYVLNKAMDSSVPVLVVPRGTLDTIAAIETFVTRPTFHHPAKLSCFAGLLGKHLDISALRL